MANRIIISFTANPVSFESLRFNLDNTSTGYHRFIYKRFTSGTPTAIFHVGIDVDLEATLANVVNSMQLHDFDSIVVYSSDATNIYIDFSDGLNYDFELVTPLPATASWSYDTSPPIIPTLTLNPISIHNFSIEIIDTYTNSLPLVVNKTQMNSPKITWDGGDDLYQVFQNSKLTFNMLVEDAADGKFFHLFTGDEKRYLVRLNNLDPLDVPELLWQGYLLPDFYREPYKNVSFFVDFTATDMIGQLKGKVFKKWYYNNTFPIMKLLAAILKETGLNQPFIVAPSILNGAVGLEWKDIAVPLNHYRKGEKLTDIYVILTQVLQANVLTLCSFRGYWFLKGITRKHEEINYDCLSFDSDGIPTGKIDVVNFVSEPLKTANAPLVSAITPWKKVNINFNSVSTSSLFPEDVVVMEYDDFYVTSRLFSSPESPDFPQHLGAYETKRFDYWKFIGGAPHSNLSQNFRSIISGYPVESSMYGMDEATALNNYFEFKRNPYLLSSKNYVLEFEATTEFLWDSGDGSIELFNNIFNMGFMYYGFMFQLIVGQAEVASNRPSFPLRAFFSPKVTNNGQSDAAGYASVTYSVKCDITVGIPGPLSFRVLMPLWSNPSSDIKIYSISLKSLKLSLKKEVETENTVAVRDVNFTKEYDVNLDLTSSANGYLENNMAVNAALNLPDINTINVTIGPHKELWQFKLLNQPGPVTYILQGKIIGNQYTITSAQISLLFNLDLIRKNLFVQKASGEELPFDLIANRGVLSADFFSIESIVGYPILPEGYHPQTNIAPGDVLKYMYIPYASDNILLRDKWYLHGGSNFTTETFTKTLARAIHNVQPDTLYSLETTFLKCVFPNEFATFSYFNEDRNFIPTTFTVDLSGGKTTAKCMESKYQPLNDISYE